MEYRATAKLRASKILLLAVAMLAAVRCAGERETVKGTLKGTIYVIGNEPFTSLAVEDSTGKMYRIGTSKEIQGKLLGLQGKIVELDYTRIDSSFEGITLTVHHFRQISP